MMKVNFNGRLENFCQAGKMENMVYDEMVEYADSYNSDCVSMYVDLYKCAKISKRNNHILEHIYSIIIDEDTFKYPYEIIRDFKEVISLTDFLDEKDEDKFDDICRKILNFFRKQYRDSIWGNGQNGTAPYASIVASSMELTEVAEIIISTDMRNLRSYQMALSVLGS